MKRLAALAGLALTIAGATSQQAAAQDEAATPAGPNYAAVVIDTGDGKVRKLCLTFPEEELSGIEALRRVDTRPNRFETFAGKGSGVCLLCGVGCASGDCFCNPSKYWAYHRAGPGESEYETSRVGASSTVVRNGDVEAWKWGNGSAPVKASVSEVCGIPEPAARTTAATTTSTAPSPTTTEAGSGAGSPSTTGPSPASTAPIPAATASATSAPGAQRPASSGAPATSLVPTDAPTATPGDAVGAPADAVVDEAEPPSGSEVEPGLGADEEAAATDARRAEGTDPTQRFTLIAFVTLLGGLLVWKARIRRSKVRAVKPIR